MLLCGSINWKLTATVWHMRLGYKHLNVWLSRVSVGAGKELGRHFLDGNNDLQRAWLFFVWLLECTVLTQITLFSHWLFSHYDET